MARPHLPRSKRRDHRVILSLTEWESDVLDALQGTEYHHGSSGQDILRRLLLHEYRKLLRAGELEPVEREDD